MFDISQAIKDTLAKKASPTTDKPTKTPVTYQGSILSIPGTEKVILSTTVADFMVCQVQGTNKERYCIVHKTHKVVYNGQFTDSNGYPVSIVRKSLFDELVAMVNNMAKQMQRLQREIDTALSQRDAYKLTLDTLRRNGVID